MEKIKYPIFISIIILVLFLFFWSDFLPENARLKEVASSHPDEDVVIIFNSGGWGDTPVEKAEDLTPIVRGIEKTLSGKGYKSIVIPYERTKNGFLAKIRGARELFGYFQSQSDELAGGIKTFLENNPGKKIIMVGLSNGASFVDETMKKIDNFQNSVLAIEIGSPFWQKKMNSGNILRLDNGDQDSLVKGDVKTLLPTLFKAFPRWFLAKISGANFSFSKAFDFSEHKYSWESPGVSSSVDSFLDGKVNISK
ncbi:MAG: hypothetical protein ABH813_03560 [Patescibacteria group bacterium]